MGRGIIDKESLSSNMHGALHCYSNNLKDLVVLRSMGTFK